MPKPDGNIGSSTTPPPAQIHQVALAGSTTGDSPAITLSVTERGTGPAVVLLHGFPEIGYSWRHQIEAMANAGYRVIAPDQRGYGWSDAPEEVEAYDIFQLVGDVIGLLDHYEVDDAVVVGHDWGALIAPYVGLLRPDRVRALALLSVPYQPRRDVSVIDHLRATDPDGPFSYILHFQEPGIEAMLDGDPIGGLRSVYWGSSGARPDDYQRGDEPPPGLPPHLSQGEFENYCRAFARSGFAGGINYYRNLHRNWELTRPWHGAPLTMPTMFLAGSRDFLVDEGDGGLGTPYAAMADHCRDFRGTTIVDGAGHWVQQEAPDEVNAALLAFLDDL